VGKGGEEIIQGDVQTNTCGGGLEDACGGDEGGEGGGGGEGEGEDGGRCCGYNCGGCISVTCCCWWRVRDDAGELLYSCSTLAG